MIYRTLLILVMLLGGISNLAADTSDKNVYTEIRRIGLVSVLGNTVSLDKVGVGRIGNAHITFDLGVGVDDQMVSVLTRTLGNRFVVTPLSADAKKVYDIVAPASPSFFKDETTLYLQEVAKYLMSIQAPEGIDAIVAVIPTRYRAYSYPYMVADIPGLGAVHTSNIFISPTEHVWATYEIIVVNKRSGDIMSFPDASALGNPSPLSNAASSRCPVGKIWSPTPEDLTPDQRNALRDELRRLIWGKLQKTLALVHLPSDVDVTSQLPARPSICEPE